MNNRSGRISRRSGNRCRSDAIRKGKFMQRLIRKAILRKTGAFVNRTFK